MALACRLRFAVRRFCTEAAQSEPQVKEKLHKRIAGYFFNILNDYKIVAEEIWQDMKATPIKSGIYLSLIGGSGYLYQTNPSERDYRVKLMGHAQELAMIGAAIRNPTADNHVMQIQKYYNAGQMRRFTFGLFSVMWYGDYEEGVDVFEARAPSLKVGWLEWRDRFVDVGYNGKWHWLEKYMIDYDINPNEWPDEEKQKTRIDN